MRFEEYQKYFSPNSIGRYDIAPLYAESEVFEHLIHDLLSPFIPEEIDKVVCIEALGFVLGAAIAVTIRKGLVLIRKAGKIPLESHHILTREIIDYSGAIKILEINKHLIVENERILLVDDWVETGTQAKAAISMIEELGGHVIGIASIGADKNEQTRVLFEQYNLRAIGGDG